jgi:hypothetical protein
MLYIEAPNRVYDTSKKSIFLAGTITGAADWQAEVTKALDDFDIVVFNPRRENFPIHDPNAAFEQIKWEFDMLRKADMIQMWLASETIGPICLYELGAWSMTEKPLVIGMDPKYPRRQDVEIQTKLVRPEVSISYNMNDFIESIAVMIDQVMGS